MRLFQNVHSFEYHFTVPATKMTEWFSLPSQVKKRPGSVNLSKMKPAQKRKLVWVHLLCLVLCTPHTNQDCYCQCLCHCEFCVGVIVSVLCCRHCQCIVLPSVYCVGVIVSVIVSVLCWCHCQCIVLVSFLVLLSVFCVKRAFISLCVTVASRVAAGRLRWRGSAKPWRTPPWNPTPWRPSPITWGNAWNRKRSRASPTHSRILSSDWTLRHRLLSICPLF